MHLLKCTGKIRHEHFSEMTMACLLDHLYQQCQGISGQSCLKPDVPMQMVEPEGTHCTYAYNNFPAKKSLRTLSATFTRSDLFRACQQPLIPNINFQPQLSPQKLPSQRRKTAKPRPLTRKAWGWDNEGEHFHSLVQSLGSSLFFQWYSELSSN